MKCNRISFSGHAVRRMFQRGIKRLEVTEIIAAGETIASYPDDQPHSSFLLLGFAGATPVHVVVAQNKVATIERCLGRIAEEYIRFKVELETDHTRQDFIILLTGHLKRIPSAKMFALKHLF